MMKRYNFKDLMCHHSIIAAFLEDLYLNYRDNSHITLKEFLDTHFSTYKDKNVNITPVNLTSPVLDVVPLYLSTVYFHQNCNSALNLIDHDKEYGILVDQNNKEISIEYKFSYTAKFIRHAIAHNDFFVTNHRTFCFSGEYLIYGQYSKKGKKEVQDRQKGEWKMGYSQFQKFCMDIITKNWASP